MPDTPETILAFDFGLRRIGVAVGQQITASASPLGIVNNGEKGPDWVQIRRYIKEWNPQRLIVGMPLHADGSVSDISKVVESFIADLIQFGLPVNAVDERYSSIEAGRKLRSERAQGLRRKVRKETLDSAAATIIAERWLLLPVESDRENRH